MLKKSFGTAVFYFEILFFSALANAGTILDPMIGTKIGQVVTNKILASPPMPHIGGKEDRFQITPMVSSVVAIAHNTNESFSAYSGSLKGYSAGLGFTNNSKTKLSYYGFATFSETKGDIQSLIFTSESGVRLAGMKSSGTNLSLGASYRPWTESQFPVVIGILAGPFISSYTGSFIATSPEPSANPETQNVMSDHPYTSESFVFGPMAGIQGYFNVFGLAIKPYFLYYKDISSPCQTYKTDISMKGRFPESVKTCNDDNNEIYIDGTFSAYGLVLGFYGLSLGILAEPEKNPELSSITVQSYTLSYSFGF